MACFFGEGMGDLLFLSNRNLFWSQILGERSSSPGGRGGGGIILFGMSRIILALLHKMNPLPVRLLKAMVKVAIFFLIALAYSGEIPIKSAR